MEFANYQSFWNDKARTLQGAMIAVDGSADEATLQATGRYTGRQVCEALEISSGDHVLELGCGVGRIGSHVAPKCALWHGVDISTNMIEVARERLSSLPEGRVRLDALSRTRLESCADAAYDKAYCVAVFIHMDKEDFLIYLRELYRVLKPGGRLFFDHWNLAHPIGWKRFEMEVAQYVDFDHSQRKDVARNQFTSPQEAALFLRAAGFDVVLQLNEAPFLQAVAIKPGGEAPQAVAERLALNAGNIRYTDAWTHWFGNVFDMFSGLETPADLLRRMPAADTDEESAMYHLWVNALWRANPDRWGRRP